MGCRFESGLRLFSLLEGGSYREIMEDLVIQQIKERLDIVEIIGSYLKLQKIGRNFRALCPFHSEKKPSFFVSPSRQIFKCFGCGVGGSVFDFVMKIEGIEFGDALKILAQRAGVELRPFRPEWKTERSRLYEIMELSCRFFEKQLKAGSTGKEAQEYLVQRGVTEDSIKKWRLGYSPETWRGLFNFLKIQGYKKEEIIKSGLVVKSEKGEIIYDRFRGRIIFPIFDLNSRIIGFGGRVFKKEEEKDIAKYINTPNTLLYDKSRTLYGLNFAKIEIRRRDFAILTEGYLDVILSHQTGFENTIGCSGTSLTSEQLKILGRYTQKILTAFDMDLAGDLATKKGVDLAQKEDFEVKVVVLPPETDPADIISQNPKKWKELVAKAQDIVNFYFSTAFSKFDKETPEGKKEIAKLLLPKIKEISNKILQAHWIQKLAQAIKVKEEAIFEELKKLTKKEELTSFSTTESFRVEQKDKTRKEVLEERLLALILKDLKNLNFIRKENLSLFSPPLRLIFTILKKEKKGRNWMKILEDLKKGEQSVKEILEDVAFRIEVEKSEFSPFPLKEFSEEQIIEKEINLCLRELEKFELRNKLEFLSQEIAQAEKEKDKTRLQELIKKFNQVVHRLE